MATESDEDDPAPTKEEVKEQPPEEKMSPPSSSPSMTVSLFLTWIVPILLIAIFSRFGVDTVPPAVKVDSSRPLQIDVSKAHSSKKGSGGMMNSRKEGGTMMSSKKMMSNRPSAAPSPDLSRHPTSYQTLVKDIQGRKRIWKPKKKKSSSSGQRGASSSSSESGKRTQSSSSAMKSRSSPSEGAASAHRDPQRAQLEELIERRRDLYQQDGSVINAINLADALRHKDIKYHDGGMGQQEALTAYQDAIQQTLEKKKDHIAKGEPTNMTLSGTKNVAEEIMFDYTQKSVDGLLCSLYSNLGKLYFMANMFEKAVESYTECIEIEPMYLDAVSSRGSSLIILGKYEEAGRDFTVVIENDSEHVFNDAFTGMAKVLAVKEDNVPGGWGPMIEVLEDLIDSYENSMAAQADNQNLKQMFAEQLTRLHHVMYSYHDTKTKDREEAWKHLTEAYHHKMSAVEPYNKALEDQKLMTTKTVFHKNFWPAEIGSKTKAPIFIVGFVRSGSTLLERVLDAHPAIVGTGEDSVFNGRLDQIRNSIVQASLGGDPSALNRVVKEMADSVVVDMRKRWETIDANTAKEGDAAPKEVPERFADKMLTNYYNVGFIHMLFPDALILHVARNPMDVLWSAYKHEFPPGGLDYTSEFKSLANMYHMYREVILHWDKVLPGRITHVRYEDLVNDMPGMAKSIIAAAGLEWHDGVLEFHKKKQAVNTLSTTQVRKGIYKHSMEAWKKYETQLQPLVKMAGDEAKWDLKTSLPGYMRPPAAEE